MSDQVAEAAEYETFLRAHGAALVRFATSLSGSDDDGWDVAQECFVRLADRWERVDLDDNPVGYARRTIVNLTSNTWRSRRRERAALERLAGRRSADVADPGAGASAAPGWLAEAWPRLSRQQRVSLGLVHVWGYGVEEAAGLMGCAPSTVKTHLRRGLKMLRASAPPESLDGTGSNDRAEGGGGRHGG